MAFDRQGMATAAAGEGVSGRLSKAGLGCGLLFITPFFIGGVATLTSGIQGMQAGDKNAHVGVVVGSVFLLISTLMYAGLFVGLNRSKRINAIKAQYPDQPWQWREDWAQNLVRGEGRSNFVAAMLFALVWNGISWGVIIAAWNDLTGGGDKKAWFVVLFPLIGILLIWWTVYLFLRQRRYGVSVFRMLANPGVLGGALRGAVEIPTQVSPDAGFKVRLQCVHRYTTGSGDNRRTREDTKWEEEKLIQKDLLGHDHTRTGVPVFFNIPYDQPPTSDSPTHIWKLIVYADVPGVDYRAEFHVPVFRTEDSDPESKPLEDPTVPYQPNAGDYVWPEDSAIELRDSGASIDVNVPPARNKGCILFLLVLLLIWNGAIWFMVQEEAPLPFTLVFGFLDALFALVFLSALFYSVRFHAGPAGLRVERRFLVPVGTAVHTSDSLLKIEIDTTMQSGDKRYYGIAAIPKAGYKLRLASDIPDKRQAQWLARRVAECLEIDCQE